MDTNKKIYDEGSLISDKDNKHNDLNRRLQEAEILLAVSRELSSIDSLSEVLDVMVSMISKELSAERGSIFLHDPESNELFSIVAEGDLTRTIRIPDSVGIAGYVFHSEKSRISEDAYNDQYFNNNIDQQTGYITKSIICVPIRTVKGDIIGVSQALNKEDGPFNQQDLRLLEAMTTQSALALQATQFIEKMKKNRKQEMKFLEVVSDITSELELGVLLNKVMGEATSMLQAERSTIFLNDDKTDELWSYVGEGIGTTQIRLPNNKGIAGTVFQSGQSVNIPYAYADLRFTPSFDQETGYFTRSILCVPIINNVGKIIGVTQALNKKGGPFTDDDESRLRAFTAQVSIAMENAKLFDDVQNMKNYNESILQSMSNAVITLDETEKIVTCNVAGYRMLQLQPEEVIDKQAADFFSWSNSIIIDKIHRVQETGEQDMTMEVELEFSHIKLSLNLTIMPLISAENTNIGTMIMLEDISNEKRMKTTMARYMDPELTEKLLTGSDDFLGGQSLEATILFSDIRDFTTLTEELGPQATVSLLNEYFTIMVECIQQEEGMLDKFIGDAIMAAFGVPVPRIDDEDRAVRAAIAMLTQLTEWNVRRIDQGQKPLDMGVGLNTGMVVSGNIGSPKRMDYTLIGDGVNLASRLETACKQYGTQLLISENTKKKLRGTYRLRDIDDVIVKGKTKPVRVYEVLDFHSRTSFPNMMEMIGYFTEGRKEYNQGNWQKSINMFQDAQKLNPGDKLSTIYLERCQQLMANPPDDWQGIWVMTSK